MIVVISREQGTEKQRARGEKQGKKGTLTSCFYKDKELRQSIYICLILVTDTASVILVWELFNMLEMFQNFKTIFKLFDN